jgi:succinoglycan biosynthesis protein ExoO
VLFVGSNTAPNVVGLRWFVETVWPDIRAAMPDAVLRVAGSVAAAFPTAPDGVVFLGRVDDLAALYKEAGVVISPLLQGSGLKIKLIEALGQGKAIVATPKTVQGIEAAIGDILPVTDDAAAFADAVLKLLSNPMLRAQHGAAALQVAASTFAPARCYREFLNFVLDETAAKVATRLATSAESDTKSVTGSRVSAERALAYASGVSAVKNDDNFSANGSSSTMPAWRAASQRPVSTVSRAR